MIPSLSIGGQTSSGFLATSGVTSTLVYDFAQRYFMTAQSLFFCAFGVKEAVMDGIWVQQEVGREPPKEGWKKTVGHVREVVANMSVSHGAFYFGSGVTGGLSAMHDLGVVDLGVSYEPMVQASAVCFLFASLWALEANVRLFREAEQMKGDEDTIEQIKRSAILGILNNLGYAIATAMSLFDAPTAMVLVVGMFGLTTGAIKIVYDFVSVQPNLVHQWRD